MEDLVDFEDIPIELSPDEEETKEKFWLDADAQTLLRSLARLRKGNQLVEKDDILDDLEEAEHHPLPKTKLQALLKKFSDKSLVSKMNREAQYKVPPVYHLIRFMNPEEGELPDPSEEDEDSIDNEDGNNMGTQSCNMESNTSNAYLQIMWLMRH